LSDIFLLNIYTFNQWNYFSSKQIWSKQLCHRDN